MSLHAIIHLHNVLGDKKVDYANWFDGPHREALVRLRGFNAAHRYQVTSEQIMPDIAQPWEFMSVYDIETSTPKIDLPALAPLLAEARDSGMIETASDSERIFTYQLSSDWKASGNWHRDKPLSGVSIILGNYVAGREDEYQTWYEDVHSLEVIAVPGHVAMKRGSLADVQLEPKRYCPGDQLVMTGQQTDNLIFTIKDFGYRAAGISPSGVAMQPRSKSGSFARTVHYFKKVSGTEFWPGGIAYDGDLSLYPHDYGQA